MSAQDTEETQSTYGEGGGGPGAPTPLSALDVMLVLPMEIGIADLSYRG